MERYETEKKQINEADYIDLTVFVRAFLRLTRRYLLLICPFFICLTAAVGMLSRVMVKEQYVAETSFAVGVKLIDDFTYNYTLSDIDDYYIVQMSDAFQSVVTSEYMQDLTEEELGLSIPGEITWQSTYGTNMGGIYVVSDSMENAVQLRDAVISCLPKALFTTIGDIELTVLGTSERTNILHGNLKSPVLWVGAGAVGSIFAYLGIIFLLTLWRHDIETFEDMATITDLPCLGRLPKGRKKASDKEADLIRSNNTLDSYNTSFLEFKRHLTDVIDHQQVKTLLFTGGYKKRGQTEILDKLIHDWGNQGRKVRRINLDESKGTGTIAQIREKLHQQIEEGLKESELLLINGPGFEQTVELLSAADCVDGIVYIVKAGYDQMDNTEEAIDALSFTQAKFFGYVITV